MSVNVVDASVAAKWFLDEDLSDQSRKVLHSGRGLHAPDLLLMEIDVVFLRRVRRGDITADDARDARLILRRIPVKFHAFTAFLDNAYEIARLSGCSVYDSLYIALAALLNAKMVTADHRLYDGIRNGPFRKHIIWISDIK